MKKKCTWLANVPPSSPDSAPSVISRHGVNRPEMLGSRWSNTGEVHLIMEKVWMASLMTWYLNAPLSGCNCEKHGWQYVTAQSEQTFAALLGGSKSQTSHKIFFDFFSSSRLRIIFASVVFLGRFSIPPVPKLVSARQCGQAKTFSEPGGGWLVASVGLFWPTRSCLRIRLLSCIFIRHCLQKECAQGRITGLLNVSKQIEHTSSSEIPCDDAIIS